MGKCAQLIIGPAGSGKSTYCNTIRQHCENIKRGGVHCVNLDPAAEDCLYPVSIDIRDLISLQDVTEELGYGPNGGLVYCMEYLVENIHWLGEQLADYSDDYLLIDCPGQIELYSHLPVMRTVTDHLQKWGYNVCAVYLIDSLMITDSARYIAGTLMCLSAMVTLEVPHMNILSKCDLIQDKKQLSEFLDPDTETLIAKLSKSMSGNYRKLNEAIGSLIEDYSMVSFLPLDSNDEDSISLVLQHIDHAIQYGEDVEARDPEETDNTANDAEAEEPKGENS